jgi:uncharacterized HAD superfamily protein
VFTVIKEAFGKAKSETDTAQTSLAKATELLNQALAKDAETNSAMLALKAEMEAKLAQAMAEKSMQTEQITHMEQGITALSEQLSRLTQGFLISTSNDQYLVANGFAREIVKVINNEV